MCVADGSWTGFTSRCSQRKWHLSKWYWPIWCWCSGCCTALHNTAGKAVKHSLIIVAWISFNLWIFWCLLLFQSISISALGVGVGTESAEVVRSEPPTAAPVVNYSIKVNFYTWIVLNCLLKVGVNAVGALLFTYESNFLSFSVISRINLSHPPPHLS